MHHHAAWLLITFLPLLGFNWSGFGSAFVSLGSSVTQTLAQAGVFGNQAQQTSLTRPLAPPAAGAGATAYTAQSLSGSGILIVLIVVIGLIGLVFAFRK